VDHLPSPACEDCGGAGAPFGDRYRNVLPSLLKVKGNGGVVGESRKSTFSSVVYVFVGGADIAKLLEFIRGECVERVDDILM
jgi:hypothetical protein